MRTLPPLSALRAFEAVARNRSFKRAAEELCVTPTAISHQVRQLEELLGQKLFYRRPRRIDLSAAGQQLYPASREAFDRIAAAVETVQLSSRARPIVLTATMAASARWLIPRMTAFARKWPNLGVRLLASDDIVNLTRGEADVALRYGVGDYQGCEMVELAKLRFAPLCSPRLGVRSLDDLTHAPLVHFEWKQVRSNTPTWERWLEHAGLTRKPLPSDRTFSDESHAIEAALAGQGVILAATAFVYHELKRGDLIAPFGPEIEGEPLFVIVPKARLEDQGVAALRDWLLETARADPAFEPTELHGRSPQSPARIR